MPVSKITDYEIYGSITRYLGDGSTETIGHQFSWTQHDDQAIINFDAEALTATQLVELAQSAVELQGYLIEKNAKATATA